MSGDRLVNEKEARVLLGGIGHTTFYQLIGSGALGVVRIGRRTLVPVSQIDAFIKDGTEYVDNGPALESEPLTACDVCGQTFARPEQHKRMAHREDVDR